MWNGQTTNWHNKLIKCEMDKQQTDYLTQTMIWFFLLKKNTFIILVLSNPNLNVKMKNCQMIKSEKKN